MAAPRTTVWELEPHTRAKHEILRRYLQAWMPILAQGGFKNILYIDGFAGPGRYAGGEDGSPIIAVSLTSPIRPAVPGFSSGKSLSGKGRGGPKWQKSAVVPTKSILKAANVPIIGGHHVLALQSSPERWQATPVLERCREHAGRRWARGAAPRAVPGRDQRHAGVGMAAVDRGCGGRRRATPHSVAVSRRPLRRTIGGRLDRPRQAVGVAAAPAAAVGRVLADAAAVARAAARSVLVQAAGSEPQGDALGPGSVRAGRLPPAGAGQRMAAAPRVVSAQRPGRSLGRGCRARRDPQAVPLP